MSDLIDRQNAINAISKKQDTVFDRDEEIDTTALYVYSECKAIIKDLPSVQPEDWMERNKERILQAGMEGREIEFRIGSRLFAIREKAQ